MSVATTPTFQLLELAFAFRGPAPLVHHLTGLFAGSECDAPPAVIYDTALLPGGKARVSAGNTEIAELTSTAGVADTLMWALNRDVVASTPSNLLLHAAAVERDGEALVLIGETGSGKSTLATALVLQGWTYLTDEALFIDPASGAAQPYTKPISLKAASRPLLPAARPEPAAAAAPFFGAVEYYRPAQKCASEGVPIRAVVTLVAGSNADSTLTALRRGGGLMVLASQAFRFGDGPRDQIATMDAVVRGATSWLLTHGPLERDLLVLRHAWDRSPPAGETTAPAPSPDSAPSSTVSDVRLTKGVQHLVYEEDSVLVSRDGRSLHELDGAGTSILVALLSGLDRVQVVRQVARSADAPEQRVTYDIEALLAGLRAAGLVATARASSMA